MGPPGHVFGFGTYGRVGSFFVLGTYGGWVATLENPFGTLEALETLGTLCVALCGNKVRTNVLTSQARGSRRTHSISPAVFITVRLMFVLLFHCCRDLDGTRRYARCTHCDVSVCRPFDRPGV